MPRETDATPGTSSSSHLDPKDMAGAASRFPDQLRRALQRDAPDLSALGDAPIDKVLFTGMGGSGASGGFGRVLLDQAGSVVARSIHDYEAPAWVDARTLVIATSYSGNSEETLECLAQCSARGARWVGISSGGALEKAAMAAGAPFLKVEGGTEPRAEFGALLGALLRVLTRLGLLDEDFVMSGLDKAHDACAKILADCHPNVLEQDNPAKRLARSMQNKTILLMGDAPYEPVLERIRCQFNENGKVIAFTRTLPEANHNDTVAWGADPWVHIWTTLWVGPFDRNEALERRAEFVQDLVRDRGVPVNALDVPVEHPLARMIAISYLGDWVSLYLAFQSGRDPGDVAVIPRLKRRLEETGILAGAKKRLGIE